MTTPSIYTPSQPDLNMIRLIHRGHDGYVSFACKNADGEYDNIASIPANAMPSMFDQMIPAVEYDGLFGINGMFSPGHVKNEHGLLDQHGNPLRKARRRTQDLRWLTAIYADLDCHKLGMEPADVIGEITRLQDADQMPPASIITRSGGGVWLFWLLTGQDSTNPVRAWPEKVAWWLRIQQAFNKRFAQFGADTQAMDASRVTRIPGSINTKRKFARVGYSVQFAADGTPFTYTMEQLAAWCEVSLEIRQHDRLPGPAGKDPKAVAKGVKGQAARWTVAVENFRKLWDLRGTWRVGLRNAATMTYATILNSHPKDAILPDEQIAAELDKLYAGMDQPADDRYTRDQFKATVQAARGNASRRKSFRMLAGTRNQTFSDWLEITPEEAAVLPTWPASSKYRGVESPPPMTQGEVRRKRRELLKHHLENRKATGAELEPLHVLAELVEAAGLPRPADQTVANDLDALGHNTHRKRRPRGSGRSTQKTFFDD